jgi:acyl-homoserine lactone synthase
MIHVITAENRDLYKDALRQHHRIRHEIYIGERHWNGLQSRDGLEFDNFDNTNATYVLALEGDRVIGGSRLYPTALPHMLDQVCPALAEVKGIPRGPDIFEWTRIFAIKERREGRFGGKVVGNILCAGLEFCLAEGVTALSLVFEAWWLPRLQSHGWIIKPLGLPGLIDGEWWLAAMLPINENILAATRAHYGITERLLVRQGLSGPGLRRVA